MNIAQTLKFSQMKAAAAGTQATVPDSRAADSWIKSYLDRKNKRLDDLRKSLHTLLDYPPALDEYKRPEMRAAFRADKTSLLLQQPEKVASGGEWAVTSPEGEIISTWETKDLAERAAFPLYKGLSPSSTGATAGARVTRLHATDIFDDPKLDDETRARFIKGPKPRVVKLADFLRLGDLRPSSHGGGAAGTGGAGGPSGGGSGTS